MSTTSSNGNGVIMKNYLFMMTTAAKAAVDTSIEMKRQSGKLNIKELSQEDVKDEVSKYKRQLEDIHHIALREAKKHAKRRLNGVTSVENDNDNDNDNESEESAPSQKRVSRKRPRFDLSKYVSQKAGKRLAAEDDVLEACEELVKYLNEKYGNNNNVYKVVDSDRSTLIRIVKVTKGKESIHCLVGKYEFERTRQQQQKVKDGNSGEITRAETVKEEDHTVYNLYNDNDEIVKSFKAETVRKGDILRANAKGGSAIAIPAIRGNIMSGFDDVKIRLSRQGIQTKPVTDEVNEESDDEAEVEAEDDTNSKGKEQAEPGEPDEQAEPGEPDEQAEPVEDDKAVEDGDAEDEEV